MKIATAQRMDQLRAMPRHMRTFEEAMVGDTVRTPRGLWTLGNDHRLTPWAQRADETAILMRVLQAFGHTVLQGATIFAGRRRTRAFCAAIYVQPGALHHAELSTWGNHARHETSINLWEQRWNEWHRCRK